MIYNVQQRYIDMGTNSRTLEQRLKFDLGMTIGNHLIGLTKGAVVRKALLHIGTRGAVYLTPMPAERASIVERYRVRGDVLDSRGQPYWAKGRTDGWFDGEVEAVVEM